MVSTSVKAIHCHSNGVVDVAVRNPGLACSTNLIKFCLGHIRNPPKSMAWAQVGGSRFAKQEAFMLSNITLLGEASRSRIVGEIHGYPMFWVKVGYSSL